MARWGAGAPGVARPPGRLPPAFLDGIAGLGHSQPCFRLLPSLGVYWASHPGVGASAPALRSHHRFTGVSLKHLLHSTFKKKKKASLIHILTAWKPWPPPHPFFCLPPWKNLFKHSHIGGSVYKEAAEWCSLGNRSAAITECHMLFLPFSSKLFFFCYMQGFVFCRSRHWPGLVVTSAKYAGTVLLHFGIQQSPCVRHLLALRKRQCSAWDLPTPLPPPVFGMHWNFAVFN